MIMPLARRNYERKAYSLKKLVEKNVVVDFVPIGSNAECGKERFTVKLAKVFATVIAS